MSHANFPQLHTTLWGSIGRKSETVPIHLNEKIQNKLLNKMFMIAYFSFIENTTNVVQTRVSTSNMNLKINCFNEFNNSNSF